MLQILFYSLIAKDKLQILDKSYDAIPFIFKNIKLILGDPSSSKWKCGGCGEAKPGSECSRILDSLQKSLDELPKAPHLRDPPAIEKIIRYYKRLHFAHKLEL